MRAPWASHLMSSLTPFWRNAFPACAINPIADSFDPILDLETAPHWALVGHQLACTHYRFQPCSAWKQNPASWLGDSLRHRFLCHCCHHCGSARCSPCIVDRTDICAPGVAAIHLSQGSSLSEQSAGLCGKWRPGTWLGTTLSELHVLCWDLDPGFCLEGHVPNENILSLSSILSTHSTKPALNAE